MTGATLVPQVPLLAPAVLGTDRVMIQCSSRCQAGQAELIIQKQEIEIAPALWQCTRLPHLDLGQCSQTAKAVEATSRHIMIGISYNFIS